MSRNRETLRQLIEDNCLDVSHDYVLSTGEKSSFYFDCKKATLDGQALALISDLMLEEINKLPVKPIAIGGLTLGADFIVAGVAMRAYQVGHPTVHGSITRKEPKKHGTKNKVENQLPAGTTIVVVDDVITSGRSTLLACDEFEKEGYKIVGIIALVDREQGGADNIRKRYPNVSALFHASDFNKLDEHKKTATG